ncbi:MAG TPA: hypothetical protein VFU14_11420 [Acidimicrobiales bacterium]|nr:hypothetical protein [Acidimicrobiales bacterium]
MQREGQQRWEQVVGDLAAHFRRQVVLGDGAPIGRFDQVHRHRPLVVEIHSEKFHTMPSDIADDARRAEQLVDAGFCVVVYWEYDIWHDARVVRESLGELLARPHHPGLVRPTPAPYDLLPRPPRPDANIDRWTSIGASGTQGCVSGRARPRRR